MAQEALRLHMTLAALAPIDDVSIPTEGTSEGARIMFLPEATPQQRDAANAALANFDWSPAAQAAWEADQRPERKSLRALAAQAVADIDEYLANADSVATSTNGHGNQPAQADQASQIQARDHAAVKKLAQMMKMVIKRLVQID